jgi:hypothetical protein
MLISSSGLRALEDTVPSNSLLNLPVQAVTSLATCPA